MTLLQVFDALNGKSFGYLETRRGDKYGGELLAVGFCQGTGMEPACISVDEAGLSLHFNARANGGMEGATVYFGDIVAVG